MPRSNRPRRKSGPDADEPADLSRLLAGWKRVEHKRDGGWYVQPVSAVQAVKSYVCPGCGLAIEAGVAHVVSWRADGLLGDAAALSDRRHWHGHCWRIH